MVKATIMMLTMALDGVLRSDKTIFSVISKKEFPNILDVFIQGIGRVGLQRSRSIELRVCL